MPHETQNKYEMAVFGGGCFWCTEAVFKMLRGVISVRPGYAGGIVENPTYEQVSTGATGHAEVIEIAYDPSLVSYHTLLTIFFASHDPTSVNRQGNDVGPQYRSVIFYTTPEQRDEAERLIAEINASSIEGRSMVTTVEPLPRFYPAEDYHRDYFAHHRGDPYCELVINPKLEHIQKEFAELLRRGKDRTEGVSYVEDVLKQTLSPAQYFVMRQKGTEAPWSGKYVHKSEDGTYVCAVCGNPIFSTDAQFDSGTGWPSFDKALPGSVKLRPDTSDGMVRTEIVCARCGSHLGHVFDDGPTETGKRYCINSVCLDLKNEPA
ncbi:MAG TPA: peptide-methionine (S)-S-oxide reductase MsrA [Candidatus Paceibacterota bacterium]